MAERAIALLDARHRQAQLRVRNLVAARLAAILQAVPLGDPARDPVALYHGAALPTVRGGQQAALQLAAGYVATSTMLRGLARGGGGRLLAPPDLADAFKTVAVADDGASVVAPALRLLALVAQDKPAREARDTAAGYAAQLAGGDMQAAQRAGADAAAGVSSERIVGWRKDVVDDCCDWCHLVGDERIYRGADTVPFHDGDRCGVAPVYSDET